MQTAMNLIQNCCSELELYINADKTTTVLFTNKSLRIGFKKPKLFGQEIVLKNQVKYLGVILDSKLNWNSHIETRLKKATVALWQCRKGKSWGLKPKVVYWNYTRRLSDQF
jgi:hypothetical protein